MPDCFSADLEWCFPSADVLKKLIPGLTVGAEGERSREGFELSIYFDKPFQLMIGLKMVYEEDKNYGRRRGVVVLS